MKNYRKILNRVQDDKQRGFSLVELLIVVTIVGILSVVSYVAIQRAQTRALNEKMLDDLVVIANSMEDYRRDHQGSFPIPDPGDNQNVLCYYADASYSHSCEEADGALFRQGMLDNDLLGKRYLREVPTDPHTGSRYVFGVTNDGKYFQVAGLFENEDGDYEARTVENLAKGFELPSIIRAYDSANFVVDHGTYLPYSPNHLQLTGTLNNIDGFVTINSEDILESVSNGAVVEEGDVIRTLDATSSVDIFFSDGSESHLDPNGELELKGLKVEKNDKNGTFTKILLKINAGKIWSKVVRLSSASEFRVETNSAIAGVRGTEFSVESDNTIKVLEGEVWKVDDKNNETVTEPEIEDLNNEVPTIPVTSEGNLDISQYINPTNDADFLERYVYLPLNTSMRPHIVSVEQGTVTFRNINHFVNRVNVERALPPEYARRFRVNKLAIFRKLPDGPGGGPRQERVHTIDINQVDPFAGNHELAIPSELQTQSPPQSLIFRFEYWVQVAVITSPDACDQINGYWKPDPDPGKCFKVNRSAFSRPPVRVTTEASLSQYEIYPELFEAGEAPELTVTAPPYYSIPTGATITAPDPFSISAVVEGDFDAVDSVSFSLEYAPSISVSDYPSQPCGVDPPPLAPAVAFNSSVDYEVAVHNVGLCQLMLKATLPDGTELREPVNVTIVDASQQLVLQKPAEGASLGAVNKFRWTTNNAPPLIEFDLVVIGPVNFNFTNAVSGMPPPISLTEGAYDWLVTMYEVDAGGARLSDLETQQGTFTVLPVTNANFILEDVANPTLPLIDLAATNAPYDLIAGQNTANFALKIPSCDDQNFQYSWSVSWEPPAAALFNPPLVAGDVACPPSAAGHFLELSALGNTMPAGSSQPLAVTLTVNSSTGSYVDSITKTLNVRRPDNTFNFISIEAAVLSGSAGTPYYLGNLPLIGTPTDGGPDVSIPSSDCNFTLAETTDGTVVQTDPFIALTPEFTPAAGVTNATFICTIPVGNSYGGYEITSAGNTTSFTVSFSTFCGNGTINAGETCDDGNSIVGDGCDNLCATESGYTCSNTGVGNPGGTCTPTCGDGLIVGSEQCDGTNFNGATCATELGDATAIGDLSCSTGCLIETSSCTIPSTLVLSPVHTFYKKDTTVNYNSSDPSTPFQIIVNMPDGSPPFTSTAPGEFSLSQAGTYTIQFMDAFGGLLETVTLTACGYNGAGGTLGNECWVLGDPGDSATGLAAESCNDACNVLDGSTTGVGIDCVTGDWNDAVFDSNSQTYSNTCEICQILKPSASCEPVTIDVFSPHYLFITASLQKCFYRDNTVLQNCTALDPGKQRLCKCN